jgi:hypothetical protein
MLRKICTAESVDCVSCSNWLVSASRSGVDVAASSPFMILHPIAGSSSAAVATSAATMRLTQIAGQETPRLSSRCRCVEIVRRARCRAGGFEHRRFANAALGGGGHGVELLDR